ncbi:MAG TPA: nuclear transport factor 2 family protein [Candidatus Dormibacteraeota bacterium]|nr:nuclear transport factor 2 family protein [Candidatus Dormibacteraeota bacterium]
MTVSSTATDEAAIRTLVEAWMRAVRARDLPGILAHHSPDMVMFDLPPPLEAHGLEPYGRTWDAFFAWADQPVVFRSTQMQITAGSDVAFVWAMMRCAGTEPSGEHIELDFRLTIGLRKIAGQWTVTHEHHSIPAT